MTLPENETAYRVASWWLAHGGELLPVLGALCVLLALAVAAVLWTVRATKLVVLLTALAAAADWWSRGGWARREHSERYERTIRSPGWRRRRRGALRRAGNRCQRCGARGPLQAHHVTYVRLGREARGDLLAVRPACHDQLHDRSGRGWSRRGGGAQGG